MKIKIVGYKKWKEYSSKVTGWKEIMFPIKNPLEHPYPFFVIGEKNIPIVLKRENIVRYPESYSEAHIKELLRISQISLDDWKVEEIYEPDDKPYSYHEDFHKGLVYVSNRSEHVSYGTYYKFSNGIEEHIGCLDWSIIHFKDMANLSIPEKEIHYESLFLTSIYDYETKRNSEKYK